jgi:glycosyltransferase involved in cell wall biosynthesis
MKATVAICTHNRGIDLKEAIDSCIRQDFDPGEFEILVIDNRSTDNTKEIVLGYRDCLEPRIHYVLEENLGLSYARNRAIREARGEYILFIDDDAVASETLIQKIIEVFEMDDSIGCVGGRIDPVWQGKVPHWLPAKHRTLYSILDYSDVLKEMDHGIPFGANVAFRSSIFQVLDPFRVDLGRIGSNLLSGEESELIARIRQKYKIFYSPFASVEHKIAKDRSTTRWFLRRMYWQGVTDALRSGKKSEFFWKSGLKLVIASLALVFTFYHVTTRVRFLTIVLHGSGVIAGVLGSRAKQPINQSKAV